MYRSRIGWPVFLAVALCLAGTMAYAQPVEKPQDDNSSITNDYVPSPPVVLEPGTFPNSAVGGGTNGNIAAVNAVLSGVGLYVGNPWGTTMTDTTRKTTINNAANWGFDFIAPKIATSGGTTWYSSGTQLDNWIAWCTQAGIKFFPWSYVTPSTGGTGTTIATNRAAAIAADIANHNGFVMVDMEGEWQSSTDAYGPNMTAFGTAFRSACPDKPIVVTGFGDPGTVQGSAWPYAEMKSFADAYAPQWYYPWWSWYYNTKGVAGVKNVIDTCYNQCKTYFGSTYPVLPNGAWETSSTDAVTPAALPDLYAGTAYMKKFGAPIIWWENSNMTRAIASALVGYGYFTDQPVPTGSPARPAAIIASATSVRGGTQVTFTINIGGPAPPGGQVIGLSTTDSLALPVPASITVPHGSSSVNVVISTGLAPADTTATLTASNSATGATVTTSKTITILQAGYPVTALLVNPASVAAGDPTTGTVTISSAAPSFGETISLTSDNANVVVPSEVAIASGQTTATFAVSTKLGTAGTNVATIRAAWGTSSATTKLTVTPVGVATVVLTPSNIVAGQPSSGAITLLGPAPAGGATVSVSSNNQYVSVPTTGISVPAGATSATFDITTSPEMTATSFVTISSGLNGTTAEATLTVNPIAVTYLTLSTNVIRGGNSCTGTVTLNSPAPSGGIDVAVSSDTPDIATVDNPLKVPAGQSTATFPIKGANVANSGASNITASLNGGTITQAVTVIPRHDVNGDDAFDLKDIPEALRIVAGLSAIQGDQIVAIDMDNSGTAEIVDVIGLLKLALNQ